MVVRQFDVYGVPVPQGSHKAFVRGGRAHITDSNDKLMPWRDSIISQVRAMMDSVWGPGFFPLVGPVAVVSQFWLPRPASAPKTRDILPVKKPDTDKLLRALNDALTQSGLISDDAQIVSLGGEKFYSVTPNLTRIYRRDFHRSPGVHVEFWDRGEEVEFE